VVTFATEFLSSPTNVAIVSNLTASAEIDQQQPSKLSHSSDAIANKYRTNSRVRVKLAKMGAKITWEFFETLKQCEGLRRGEVRLRSVD
jgi:hypothetical protein